MTTSTPVPRRSTRVDSSKVTRAALLALYGPEPGSPRKAAMLATGAMTPERWASMSGRIASIQRQTPNTLVSKVQRYVSVLNSVACMESPTPAFSNAQSSPPQAALILA